MPYTIQITDRYADNTDGFWKYSVRFDHGNWASVYEYFFETEAEIDESIAKAQIGKPEMTDQNMKDFALENKNAVK